MRWALRSPPFTVCWWTITHETQEDSVLWSLAICAQRCAGQIYYYAVASERAIEHVWIRNIIFAAAAAGAISILLLARREQIIISSKTARQLLSIPIEAKMEWRIKAERFIYFFRFVSLLVQCKGLVFYSLLQIRRSLPKNFSSNYSNKAIKANVVVVLVVAVDVPFTRCN